MLSLPSPDRLVFSTGHNIICEYWCIIRMYYMSLTMLACMRQFNTAERCGQQQQKIVHAINIVCVCVWDVLFCFVLFFRKVKYTYEINKKDNNSSFVIKMSPFPCDFGLQVSTNLCRNAELRTHGIKYFNVDPTFHHILQFIRNTVTFLPSWILSLNVFFIKFDCKTWIE